MEKSYAAVEEMKTKAFEQGDVIEELHQKVSDIQQELSETKQELKRAREELSQTRETLEAITNSTTWSSAQPSFADVARTPPESHPSNIRTLSTTRTTSTNASSAIYCAIEVPDTDDNTTEKVTAKTVRAILEGEIRANPGQTRGDAEQ